MIFEESKGWTWDSKKTDDIGGVFKLSFSSNLNCEDINVQEASKV